MSHREKIMNLMHFLPLRPTRNARLDSELLKPIVWQQFAAFADEPLDRIPAAVANFQAINSRRRRWADPQHSRRRMILRRSSAGHRWTPLIRLTFVCLLILNLGTMAAVSLKLTAD